MQGNGKTLSGKRNRRGNHGYACKNCGMIFISHRLASAVLADRIYLMEHGKVAECGNHEELMHKNGKYAEMFRRQAENYLEEAYVEE